MPACSSLIAPSTSPVSSSAWPSALCAGNAFGAAATACCAHGSAVCAVAALQVLERDLHQRPGVPGLQLELPLEFLDRLVGLLLEQEHAVGVVHVRRLRVAGDERLERLLGGGGVARRHHVAGAAGHQHHLAAVGRQSRSAAAASGASRSPSPRSRAGCRPLRPRTRRASRAPARTARCASSGSRRDSARRCRAPACRRRRGSATAAGAAATGRSPSGRTRTGRETRTPRRSSAPAARPCGTRRGTR